MVQYIYKVARLVAIGSLIIYYDNLKIVQWIDIRIIKVSQNAEEGLSSILEIKSIINKLKFNIFIEYTNGDLKQLQSFQANSIA